MGKVTVYTFMVTHKGKRQRAMVLGSSVEEAVARIHLSTEPWCRTAELDTLKPLESGALRSWSE